jgi:hypothetical protein
MDTRVLYTCGLELKNGGFLPGGSMHNLADADIFGKNFPRRGFMNSVLLSIRLALHTLATVQLVGNYLLAAPGASLSTCSPRPSR